MSNVSSEAITAAGNLCRGLGIAISGLSRGGSTEKAVELADELKRVSKSLSWLLREDRDQYGTKKNGDRSNGS